MDYERIHKVQTGIISPSKLRMKLMGSHNHKKKEGSNNNSSRTSPSKLGDTEFVKNSLLATESEDLDEEVLRLEAPAMKISEKIVSSTGESDHGFYLPKENGDAVPVKLQPFQRVDIPNSSFFHQGRTTEDENLDYDSTSSFEFHKGERTAHNPKTRSFSRPMPSKWNDAEKWITSRQSMLPNSSKKNHLQNQVNRSSGMDMARVAPEYVGYDNKPSIKRVDFCQSSSLVGLEKFSFVPHSLSGQPNGANVLVDMCTQSKDLTLMELDKLDFPCTKGSTKDVAGIPGVRAVSMRDMGTEMTPIPSQEPSQTATPVGATTPLRSPNSSTPSTPRRTEPAPTPTEDATHAASHPTGKKELSELELKLKTRKEIVALGVQLGKMNIAAWASKEEREMNAKAGEATDTEELERIEFAKRAAAWEEAEKSKHMARYKKEEIKIQAWESQQKSKLEAEMRRLEARVEQMKAQAQAKVVKKIALARQKSEVKRAAAEARKNQQAQRTAAQAEYIRQTGRIPSTPLICCGWS